MDKIAELTSKNEDKSIDMKLGAGVAAVVFSSYTAEKPPSLRVFVSNLVDYDEAYANTLYTVARGLAHILIHNWNDVINIGYEQLVKENESKLDTMTPADNA